MNMDRGAQLNLDRLPPELTSRLNAMVRRVRRLIAIRGGLATLAVLLGSALGIMAVDAAVLISEDAVRWGLSCAALFLTLATAWVMLVRPLRMPLSPTRIARVLETRHPELQERISSALELLALGGSAATQGSEQLIQALAQDAQVDVAGVQPRHEFTGRTVKPFLVAAAATVGVLGVLFVAWPRQTVLLFARAVAPYAAIDNLQGSLLEVEPGDAVRLQGEELAIRLTVRGGGNSRAEVRSVGEDGREALERMRRVSLPGAVDSVYALDFPSVTASFRYRVRHGAGLTRSYLVRVMPPPAITRCTVAYHYPAYTGLAATQMTATVREIAALDGTRVQIDADFDRPADGVLLLGSRRFPGSRKKTPGAFWALTLSTNLAPRWALALRDPYGFTNRLEWAPLRVESDQPPTVSLTYPPAARFVVQPFGRVEFAYDLADDFGLGPVRLIVQAEGAKDEATRDVVLQPAGRNAWTVRYELDLARMHVAGVRQFKVWLRAADSRPPEFGGANVVDSRVVTLVIDEQGRNVNDQVRAEQRATLTAMLKEAAQRLTDAASGVAGVKGRLAVAVLPPETVQPVTLAQQRAVGAEDLVTRAAAMAAQSFFASVAAEIEQVVRTEIAPARACTEDVLLCQPAVRPAKGDEAERELRDAAAKTLALIKALDALDAKAKEAAALRDLADREQALADRAADRKLTPEEADAWKKRQEELARQLAEQPKPTDAAAEELARQALRDMTNAVQAMQAEPPANAAEQQAARQAQQAADQARQAAENALAAGQLAETHAENRSAAQQAQDAAKQAEEAAKQAALAAEQARQAATAQQTEQAVAQAAERGDAAADALKAAQQAEQAAKQAEQAGQQAEQAAQHQQQGQPEQADKQARQADKQAQQANQTAQQAQAAAQEAQREARQEQAPRAEKAGEMAQAAAELGARAAELAQQSAQMAAQARALPQDQQPAQTQQAADKARQAQDMAREAAQQAQEAQKLAQAEAQAAEQAQQPAVPTEAQIEQQAAQAVQSAQKASQAAQQAAQAAQQASQSAQSPTLQQAAQQAEQAAQKADQAAGLAQEAGQRVDRTERADLPEARAGDENRQALQEAEMAAELAREAAEQARRAAQLAQQELSSLAAEALQDAALAAQQAQQASQTAQQAASQAQQAQSPLATQAASQAQQAAQTAQQAAQLAQQSVQTAQQNSAPTDQQAVQQAQQAQALAQQALQQVAQSAQAGQQVQQPGSAQQQAAQQAQQAAQHMQQAAGQQAQQAGLQATPQQWHVDEQPAQPSERQQENRNLGVREFMPLFLKEMGFPEAEWARFKGRVDAQMLEGLLKNVAPEYRELVRRYFLELARAGQQEGSR